MRAETNKGRAASAVQGVMDVDGAAGW